MDNWVDWLEIQGSPLLMFKHGEMAWNGEVLSQGHLVEVVKYQVVDANPWLLFETNSLGESPSVDPWLRRQSEGVAHGWRFGEKILQDGSETATLETGIGAVTVRDLIF